MQKDSAFIKSPVISPVAQTAIHLKVASNPEPKWLDTRQIQVARLPIPVKGHTHELSGSQNEITTLQRDPTLRHDPTPIDTLPPALDKSQLPMPLITHSGLLDSRDEMFAPEPTERARNFRIEVNRIPEDVGAQGDGEPERPQLRKSKTATIEGRNERSVEPGSPTLSFAQRQWRKIGNAFRTLRLMYQKEVVEVRSPEQIHNEFESPERIFTFHEGSPRGERRNSQGNGTPASPEMRTMRESINTFREIELFCKCAVNGAQEDLVKMHSLYAGHPSRSLYEPEDARNFLNKLNSKGCNALYLAAKNGNTRIVQFLVDLSANAMIASELPGDVRDTPLEAAVRWGHLHVVETLLGKCKFKYSYLDTCRSLSSNRAITALLDERLIGRKSWFKRCITCEDD